MQKSLGRRDQEALTLTGWPDWFVQIGGAANGWEGTLD